MAPACANVVLLADAQVTITDRPNDRLTHAEEEASVSRAQRSAVARSLGQRLKKLRADAVFRSTLPDQVKVEDDGVSRLMAQSAAKLVSVDPAKWSKWENGVNLPDIFSLIRIARAFDVDLNWLLTGHERRPRK